MGYVTPNIAKGELVLVNHKVPNINTGDETLATLFYANGSQAVVDPPVSRHEFALYELPPAATPQQVVDAIGAQGAFDEYVGVFPATSYESSEKWITILRNGLSLYIGVDADRGCLDLHPVTRSVIELDGRTWRFGVPAASPNPRTVFRVPIDEMTNRLHIGLEDIRDYMQNNHLEEWLQHGLIPEP